MSYKYVNLIVLLVTLYILFYAQYMYVSVQEGRRPRLPEAAGRLRGLRRGQEALGFRGMWRQNGRFLKGQQPSRAERSEKEVQRTVSSPLGTVDEAALSRGRLTLAGASAQLLVSEQTVPRESLGATPLAEPGLRDPASGGPHPRPELSPRVGATCSALLDACLPVLI